MGWVCRDLDKGLWVQGFGVHEDWGTQGFGAWGLGHRVGTQGFRVHGDVGTGRAGTQGLGRRVHTGIGVHWDVGTWIWAHRDWGMGWARELGHRVDTQGFGHGDLGTGIWCTQGFGAHGDWGMGWAHRDLGTRIRAQRFGYRVDAQGLGHLGIWAQGFGVCRDLGTGWAHGDCGTRGFGFKDLGTELPPPVRPQPLTSNLRMSFPFWKGLL